MSHTKLRTYTVGQLEVSVRTMTGRMEHYVSVRIRVKGKEVESYMLLDSEVDNHAKKRGWVAA